MVIPGEHQAAKKRCRNGKDAGVYTQVGNNAASIFLQSIYYGIAAKASTHEQVLSARR